MIDIANLRYRWPKADHVCLAIDELHLAAGEALFLYGPSGSGKSTLLGLLAGVLLPDQGSVAVKGEAWSSLSNARRDAYRADHVGYIFQQFNLLPYLSVLDNVMLPCRFSAVRHDRAIRGGSSVVTIAQELLLQVGLVEGLWRRPAASLSVGQQQRVAAARALIGQPEVIIADEPTSALDMSLRDSFMDLLLGQCRQANTTLIFVSHDERLSARFDSKLLLADINGAVSSAPEIARVA
ncbi:MAG: ABC transporter ATP-binding protein [Polaromonas sp.]